MPRFRFSLEKLLLVREKEEEQAKKTMQLLSAFLAQEEKKLHSLFDEKEKTNLTSRTDAHSLQQKSQYWNYYEGIRQQIMQQEEKIMQMKNSFANKKQKWLQKKTEKEVLLHLREKQYAKWKKQEMKRENKQLEEIIVQRYQNKSLAEE